MSKVVIYNRVRYQFENDVPVKAIRDLINLYFPGKGRKGIRDAIWVTILRGGRAEKLVGEIAFSSPFMVQKLLREIDATVNGTMDVCMEPPRRVR